MMLSQPADFLGVLEGNAKLVLLVASEMANPFILRVCGHCQGQGLVNNQCLVEPVHSPAQAAEVSLPTVR